MSRYLGQRSATGVTNLTNPYTAGGWVVAFTPQVLNIQVEFEVYHVVAIGPSGSIFEEWLDNTPYDAANPGDFWSWDPNQPMVVRPGQSIYYYWNVSTGTAPTVWIFCRQTSAF